MTDEFPPPNATPTSTPGAAMPPDRPLLSDGHPRSELVDGARAEPAWRAAVDKLKSTIDGLELLFGEPLAGPVRENAWAIENEAARLASALTEVMVEARSAKLREQAACEVVAQMHAAAVGEVRGPIRGVVEDVANVRAALVRALDDIDQGYTAASVELAAAKAEADSLRGAINRWKQNRAVHPDTANRALRAARDAREAAAEAAAAGEAEGE